MTSTKPFSSSSGDPQSITAAKLINSTNYPDLCKDDVRLIRVFYLEVWQNGVFFIRVNVSRVASLLVQTGGIPDHTPEDRQVLTEEPTSW